jgi:hypothetical protein
MSSIVLPVWTVIHGGRCCFDSWHNIKPRPQKPIQFIFERSRGTVRVTLIGLLGSATDFAELPRLSLYCMTKADDKAIVALVA